MNLKNRERNQIFIEKSLKKYLKQSIHIKYQDENKRTIPMVRVGVCVCVNEWETITKPKFKHLKETFK